MGLGISKTFIIFFILSIVIAIGTKNWKIGVVLMGIYAGIKIIWKFLTEK